MQKNQGTALCHHWTASKPRNSKFASWLKDSGRDVSRLPSRKSSLSPAQTGKGLPAQQTTQLLLLSDPMINSCVTPNWIDPWNMKGCSLALGGQTVGIGASVCFFLYLEHRHNQECGVSSRNMTKNWLVASGVNRPKGQLYWWST